MTREPSGVIARLRSTPLMVRAAAPDAASGRRETRGGTAQRARVRPRRRCPQPWRSRARPPRRDDALPQRSAWQRCDRADPTGAARLAALLQNKQRGRDVSDAPPALLLRDNAAGAYRIAVGVAGGSAFQSGSLRADATRGRPSRPRPRTPACPSASRRARIRTPRCRCACRPACPVPAPGLM